MSNAFIDNLVKMATGTNDTPSAVSPMDAFNASAQAANTPDPDVVAKLQDGSPNTQNVAPQNAYVVSANPWPVGVGAGTAIGSGLLARNKLAPYLTNVGLGNNQLYSEIVGDPSRANTGALAKKLFGLTASDPKPSGANKASLSALRDVVNQFDYNGKTLAEWNKPVGGNWLTRPFRGAAKYLGRNAAAGEALKDVESLTAKDLGSNSFKDILNTAGKDLMTEAHSGKIGAGLAALATLTGGGTWAYQHYRNKLPAPVVNPDLLAIQKQHEAARVKEVNDAIAGTQQSAGQTGTADQSSMSPTAKALLATAVGLPLAYGGYKLYQNYNKKKKNLDTAMPQE